MFFDIIVKSTVMFHSIETREKIVEEKLSGKSLLSISSELSISYSTVRRIWNLYAAGGKENLRPAYDNCGLKQPKFYRIYRLSIVLKRKYSDWGAPFILTILGQRYPNETLPSNRTVQKWFRKNNLSRPRIKRDPPTILGVEHPHDCWQIDAKEIIKLGDNSQACYLTTVDVKSGAVLETPVFPPQEH